MVFHTSFNLRDKITEAKNILHDGRASASALDVILENIIKNTVFETLDDVSMSSLYELEAMVFDRCIQDSTWKGTAMKLNAILPFEFSRVLNEHKPLIFSYFDPDALRKMSQVNKEFNHLASEAKILWIHTHRQPLYKIMQYTRLRHLLKLQGSHLKYFEFSSIKIPYNREMFFEWISYCPHITHLILKDCMLSDEDIDPLLKLSKVTVLNLSHNSLTPVGIAKLVQSSIFAGLVELDLSHNQIGDELASQIIEKGENLETLNLNEDLIPSGKIGKQTAISVAECMQLKKLTHLFLENNPIDNEGINRIINSSKLGSLRSLAFSSNSITHENLRIDVSFTTPDYVFYELKNSYQNWIRVRFNHPVH